MINNVSRTMINGTISPDTKQSKPRQAKSGVSSVNAENVDSGTSAYGIADVNAYYSDLKIENLRRLVEDMLRNQGELKNGAVIDMRTVNQAKLAIAEDGPFGVKAVSERIVQFAIAVSGDDPAKLGELKSAIDKGFAEARKALGGTLPDICNQTYDEVMRKLDDWAGQKEAV
jgi:hypothetical protein